jgi:hypothetical protein
MRGSMRKLTCCSKITIVWDFFQHFRREKLQFLPREKNTLAVPAETTLFEQSKERVSP